MYDTGTGYREPYYPHAQPSLYQPQPLYEPQTAAFAQTQDRTAPDDGVFVYPQNLPGALALIEQAVTGESEDRAFYTWLMGKAPSEEDRQIIAGIRDNEIGHYRLFGQIYYETAGRVLPQQPQEAFTPPATYCEGLARALLGEQKAVQKYRRILYAMQPRVHINMLTEIITDEIRHGILYSYLYAKNGCRG